MPSAGSSRPPEPSTRGGAGGTVFPARGAALAAVLLLGLGLRLWGIDFGMPLRSNVYVRPDETLVTVPAVRFVEWRGNPRFFIYPNLTATLCAGLFRAYYHGAELLGRAAAGTLALDFGRDPSPYFLLARLLSAAAGALAVFWVYRLGRMLGSPAAGLAAALLYATAPLAVRDAHFGVTDTLLACLSALAVLCLVAGLEEGAGRPRRRLLAAAIFLGLALSTKYTALVLFPLFFAASFLAAGGASPARRGLRGAALLAGALAVFLLVNPYVILDFSTFRADVLKEYLHQTEGGIEAVSPGFWNVFLPLRFGAGGWLGLAAVLPGVLLPWGRGGFRDRLILAGAALLFLLPLAFTRTPFFRYAVPALPFLAVLAGRGFLLPADRPWRLPGKGLACALLLLAVAPAFLRSVGLDRLLARVDTRTLAGRWIEAHVPPETPVIFFGRPEREPQLAETEASLRRRMEDLRRIFGSRGGAVLSEIHGMQRAAAVLRPGPRYAVIRNPPRLDLPSGKACVVFGTYPVGLAGAGEGRRAGRMPAGAKRVFITAVPVEARDLVLDRCDAFYLPFAPIEEVRRPGPNLEIVVFRP